MEYTFMKDLPTAQEVLELKEEAGWILTDPACTQAGLDNSLFGVSIRLDGRDGKVVGMARVVGDGHTVFYIQDVIVRPPYQRQGLATQMLKAIMEYLETTACPGAIVGLMSAPGKEPLYERFGFWTRPVGHHGHGMMQYWKLDYK